MACESMLCSLDMGHYFENNQYPQFQNGVFTTLVKKSRAFEFWDEHEARLRLSSSLYFSLNDSEENEVIKRVKLAIKNIPQGDLRVKISIYPKQQDSRDLSIALFWENLSHNDTPKKLAIIDRKFQDSYKNCKIENYSEVFLTRRNLAQEGFDDFISTDTNGIFLRASTSNFFVIIGNSMIIPDFRSANQFRGISIDFMKKCLSQNFEVVTKMVDYDLITKADGFFLINCITGPAQVRSIGNVEFDNQKLFEQIRSKWICPKSEI